MGRKPAGANRDEPRRHPEAIELARAAEEEAIDNFDAEGGHRTMPQDDVSRKCSQATEDLSMMLASGEISLGQYLFSGTKTAT